MELLRPLRALGEKLSRFTGGRKVVNEPPLDPHFYSAIEARCKSMLVRYYTDPQGLRGIGEVGRATANFRAASESFQRLQAELGIKSDIVPYLKADINAHRDMGDELRIRTREKVLSMVKPDRRSAIEGEALLEAKRVLSEKLKQEDLNKDYRTAATAMIMKIDEHLKRDIPQPGENSKKPT